MFIVGLTCTCEGDDNSPVDTDGGEVEDGGGTAAAVECHPRVTQVVSQFPYATVYLFVSHIIQ